MGLFDFLFSSKSKTSAEQSATQTQNQSNTGTSSTQQTGTQNQTNNQTGTTNTTSTGTQDTTGTTQQQQTTTGQQKTAGQQVTSTLDPAIQAALASLIPGLTGGAAGAGDAGNPNVAALQNIAALLANNGQAGGNVDQQVLAAQNEAKRNFASGEGAQIKQTQQQVGSTGNSFSQLIQQQGNIDLSTSLANIDAQTRANARAQNTNDFQAAIQALTGATSADLASSNQPLAQLLAVVQALTGTSVSTSSTQTTDTLQTLLDSISQISKQATSAAGSTATTLQDILNAVTSGSSDTQSQESATATGTSSGTSSGTSVNTPSLIQDITGILNAVNKK